MATAKSFWLMKSEPSVYSIDNLKKDRRTLWSGVRNYQARNFMMKGMQAGDEVLFYHSSSDVTGIAGLARVSKAAVPDPTALNKKSEYFDPKATKENPIWYCVEVEFVEKFAKVYELSEIKKASELKGMVLVKPGSRLSVQPVSVQEMAFIKRHCGVK